MRLLTKSLLILLIIGIQPVKSQILDEPWPVEANDYKKIVIETIHSEALKISNLSNSDPKLRSSLPSTSKPKFSKGQLKVQELLKKNREKLQEKRNNRSNSWLDKKNNRQKGWLKEKKEEQEKWIERKQQILNRWKKQKKKFQESIPKLKKHLIPAKQIENKEVNSSYKNEPVFSSQKVNEYSPPPLTLVEQTFQLPIKHQGERATCAAFSAIRSIEIKHLKQKKGILNLSEEYFFYLSRPDCHNQLCKQDGSWPRLAFKQLINPKKKTYIPTEAQCPYRYSQKTQNIFHLPLKEECNKGRVTIQSFFQIKKDQQLSLLVKHKTTLIMGFYVSDQFINNNGLIYENSSDPKSHKRFAHTVLVVGVVPLPAQSYSKYGHYCLLAVNSWGTGWGIGGYSCLTESWIKRNQIVNKSLYAAL